MAKLHEVMDMNARSTHKSAGRDLDELRIRKASNGGHIVTHSFKSEKGYHEPEVHVFGEGDGKELLAHVAKHMNIKGDEDGDGAVETAAG